jgi:hypothetical protein
LLPVLSPRARSLVLPLLLTLIGAMTVAPSAFAESVVYPEDDAYISQAAPAKNFGSATIMKADQASSANLASNLEFLVPALDGDVQSAKLRLYVTDASADGVRVRATAHGWSESKLTWNNRPAVTSGNLDSVTSFPSGAWLVLDVTDAVTGQGRVSLQVDSLGTDGSAFNTAESSLDPRLVITTSTAGTDPVPPPPTTTTYGPVTRSAPTTSYITPASYGAKGDNSTDDTAAMQKALNAAAGKTLWLPAGKTYKVSQTIAVPSKATIIGAGTTSVIRFTWTGVTSAGSGGGSNLRTAGTSSNNINLSNFVLQGGGDGLPGGVKAGNPEGLVPLVKLIKVNTFSFKHMELRNADGLSISYSGSTNGTFQYNHVHHSGRDGITGYRDSAANVTNILIDNNLIEKTGDDAIAINGLVPGQNLKPLADGSSPLPKGITITNNVIRGWGNSLPAGSEDAAGRGIALNGVAGATVQNNNLNYPNSMGILMTGCNDHICDTSTTDWYSTNVHLLGNVIAHSTGGAHPGAITIIKTRNAEVRDNKASYSAPYNFSGALNSVFSNNTQTNVV